MNPLLIVVLIVAGAVAVAGIFRPFLGLFVLILIHFIQPGEMVPELDPLRIELVYGVLVLASFIKRTISRQGPPLFADPILRALGQFMLIAAITIPGSFWISGSIYQWTNLFKIAIFVFLMKALIERPKQLNAMLWLQVIILSWLAGSGLWGFVHGQGYELHYNLGSIDRAQGINSIAGGPNELAGLLVALLPYLVALFEVVKNIILRLLMLGVGVVSLAMIILAGSRIAVVSLLCIAAFYVVTSKRRIATLVFVLAIVATSWQLTPPEYQQRYLSVANYAEGEKLDDSNQLRLRIWEAGGKMLLDHPVLGVGLGQFQTAFGTKYSGVAHGAWMSPHNLLLQVACETGLIGLFFFGKFIFAIFKANFSLHRFAGDGSDVVHAVAKACSATLLGVVALSCVSHTLFRPYWYFVAGLVAANTTVAAGLARRGESPASDLDTSLVSGDGELSHTSKLTVESPAHAHENGGPSPSHAIRSWR